ncbi:ATP-binding cassette domain-containing protein [Rathayibacter sp. VKM Ac-2759]|uniref:amino acid ABC transporter ATP-binding protein n=1 Tax=Rathayibacter sp. VKM Ac-2759 TaxID=2609252 RepID=UPI001316B851|nr:amino acid ABC transporter ATP-binding protein [Rathayibacter sp. VKM Ac-2759]QHC68043.1 ATP-binding cassette domain-containing protein [Rathayibacter sp. VKM Ac-2759]
MVFSLGTRTSPIPLSGGVRVTGLGKSYGSHRVLADVDLHMKEGEVVSIIGPSGAGKSTFLRCLNYLEEPTEGEIAIGGARVVAGGKRPDKASLDHLRRVTGMVFQSFNLFPHLTVLENITLPQRKVLGTSKEKAREVADSLLKRVGLPEKAGEYPARLSGGQQQRIAIARALALSPRVMLFDEPTSALDPEIGLEVLAVMRDLADEGMTMLVVTHEMHFARDVSDRIMVMGGGGVLEIGPSKQVMSDPSNERTRQFLKAVLDR